VSGILLEEIEYFLLKECHSRLTTHDSRLTTHFFVIIAAILIGRTAEIDNKNGKFTRIQVFLKKIAKQSSGFKSL